jgi:ABC-2 type transport system permease protein
VNGVARRPGLLWLLRPKLSTKLNRARTDEGRIFKAFLLGFMGLFFWSLMFAVIFRMLIYFRGTQGIGDLLASKLLGMAFITFLMILVLSNVITALSTFFLSEDLELLVAAPVEAETVYGARLIETIVDSSWMVALLAVPLLIAYGVVYAADGWYYLLAVGTLIPFLIIPAVLGSAVTLVLVNVFPARRTRDLLALVGLFAAAGVVALLRFIRPERLMQPEEFRDLVDFVAVLRTPTSPWLPSEWAAEALMSYLGGFFQWFPFAFLWSTAGVCLVAGAWLHRNHYQEGFTRAQEGAQQRTSGRARSLLLERLFSGARPSTRSLVAKEIKVFFRDTTQWSQLILLGVLVAVYVYNITVLPLYTGEQISFLLINVVSFLNLGLAGFVVAAIAARFVFPAMSIEGRMMWLLRSSPLDVRELFWSKYWVGTVPLLAIAIPLIVITNVVLDASPFILTLTTLTMVGMTFALTALALGFGALYPKYDTENVAEIPTSFGGLLFMMCAVSYLAGVVILEGWPVFLYLNAQLQGGEASVGATPVAIGITGAAVLTLVAVWVPLRAGMSKVRSTEF